MEYLKIVGRHVEVRKYGNIKNAPGNIKTKGTRREHTRNTKGKHKEQIGEHRNTLEHIGMTRVWKVSEGLFKVPPRFYKGVQRTLNGNRPFSQPRLRLQIRLRLVWPRSLQLCFVNVLRASDKITEPEADSRAEAMIFEKGHRLSISHNTKEPHF